MSDILKARVAKLEQDSKQPQNDSPFEKAFNIPESVAVQLKKHTPFEENVEPEVYQNDGMRHRKQKEKLQHGTAENPKDREAPTISQNISSVKKIPIL
ncbi:unnamed protein product [Rhizophagus irregularis]|nr:unnamed protein product [Rhizophagus irregularis]